MNQETIPDFGTIMKKLLVGILVIYGVLFITMFLIGDGKTNTQPLGTDK